MVHATIYGKKTISLSQGLERKTNGLGLNFHVKYNFLALRLVYKLVFMKIIKQLHWRQRKFID